MFLYLQNPRVQVLRWDLRKTFYMIQFYFFCEQRDRLLQRLLFALKQIYICHLWESQRNFCGILQLLSYRVKRKYPDIILHILESYQKKVVFCNIQVFQQNSSEISRSITLKTDCMHPYRFLQIPRRLAYWNSIYFDQVSQWYLHNIFQPIHPQVFSKLFYRLQGTCFFSLFFWSLLFKSVQKPHLQTRKTTFLYFLPSRKVFLCSKYLITWNLVIYLIRIDLFLLWNHQSAYQSASFNPFTFQFSSQEEVYHIYWEFQKSLCQDTRHTKSWQLYPFHA